MKVLSVTPHVLRCSVAIPFQSAFSTFHDRWACLVEIACEGGIAGWGECLGPALPNAALVQAMAPLVIGRDARDIEPIWAEVYNQFRDQGQRGATMTAQSGLDIALWDAVGKHYGEPVWRLMGGAFRLDIPAYATGGFRQVGRDRVAALVEEVSAYAAQGFGATKIKIGHGFGDDLASIAAVRRAIGPDMRLMIDANHGFDALEAAALGRAAAAHDVEWFEEPVAPEHLDAYGEVRRSQPIPVAGGETWHGRSAFAQALAAKAVDVLQPDVCGCGGITEMRKIVAMAETAGVRVVPHVWGTAVAMAASLHVIATIPDQPRRHRPRAPWFEFDQTPHAYRQEIATRPIACANGVVRPPEGPGLGVEIDRAVLAKFRVGP